MAITSTFYTGAVDNVDWAKGSGRLGFSYVAHGANDCKVTSVSTGTRTVRIATGVISGGGITDVNDSAVDIALPNVTSGSQWFMIVARRVWQTTNATTFTYIAGTATRQLPPRTANPGTQDDQPLALVRIAAGQTLPQEIVDLRVVGSNNGVMVGFDDLCLQYLTDVGTVVRIGEVEWTRALSTAGAAQWRRNGDPASGERPHIMVYRDTAFSGTISSGSVPLYAGTKNNTQGDSATHFGYSYGTSGFAGNPAQDPARILIKTGGVYALGARLSITPTTAAHFGFGLSVPGAGIATPYERYYVYPNEHSEKSLTDTRFLPAGSELRAFMGQNGSAFQVHRWYMWATRISD